MGWTEASGDRGGNHIWLYRPQLAVDARRLLACQQRQREAELPTVNREFCYNFCYNFCGCDVRILFTSTDLGEPVTRSRPMPQAERANRTWCLHSAVPECPLLLIHGPTKHLIPAPPGNPHAPLRRSPHQTQVNMEGSICNPSQPRTACNSCLFASAAPTLSLWTKKGCLSSQYLCPLHHVTYPHMGRVGCHCQDGVLQVTLRHNLHRPHERPTTLWLHSFCPHGI